jgi:alpha-amylase
MNRPQGLKKFWLLLALAALCAVTVAAQDSPAPLTAADRIYFLMTDRFADGDPANDQNVLRSDPSAYHGGDFQGIIDKLDYIRDLGFTAVWISPVVANQFRGYHGYWASDFYRTNEHFGSLAKLKELVAAAHARGLKVLADLVVNHTGLLHPWVGEPEYESWFHPRRTIANWNDQREIEDGWLAGLPDLNQENPAVREYLITMAQWWIRETGIDGYRLDTVRHVPQEFWREFAAALKKEFPGFYLIGEVWDGRPDSVAGYQRAGLDGLVDFPIYYAIHDVFAGDRPGARLAQLIRECAAVYPDRSRMGTFIDNHDVPRFVSQVHNLRDERLRQALAFLMTYTGIPILYYGTEIGLDGGADPDNRRDMDWKARSPLTDYVKKLNAIRAANPALTQGDLTLLPDRPDLFGYTRSFESNRILTVFNLANQKRRVELELPEGWGEPGSTLRGLTGSENYRLRRGKLQLQLAPRQVNLFRCEPK